MKPITPASLTVFEPHKGGRPRAVDPGVRVSAWIPGSEYDRLVALAKLRRQSVSTLVKSLLHVRLAGIPPK